VLGTAHVFEAARLSQHVRSIVNVTTDKCYANQEWCWGSREDDRLGGHDPYSNSKACSELLTEAYRASFYRAASIGLASARAGNVIGGGDWAEDRLLPDIMRACINQTSLTVRNPNAIRPWQHVLEPLSGYLLLAEQLATHPHHYAEAWNFGPLDNDARSVAWIVDFVTRHWHQPIDWTLDVTKQVHEAHRLRLDCSKAMDSLGWKPRWNLEQALSQTITWYAAFDAQACLHEVTLEQIKQYRLLSEREKLTEEWCNE
jgi:CDP-glucose 4,6-dehydratase